MRRGISVREFARRAGCDEKVVRRKIKSGHLPAFSDGKLNPAHVDLDWRNGIDADTVSADTADTADTETLAAEADRIVNLEGRAPYTKAEAERERQCVSSSRQPHTNGQARLAPGVVASVIALKQVLAAASPAARDPEPVIPLAPRTPVASGLTPAGPCGQTDHERVRWPDNPQGRGMGEPATAGPAPIGESGQNILAVRRSQRAHSRRKKPQLSPGPEVTAGVQIRTCRRCRSGCRWFSA
ncbi:hypothetical protein M2281_005763 [Mesorhizobium soli]|nr:hypothetical protein [Mesorhizobium soli]